MLNTRHYAFQLPVRFASNIFLSLSLLNAAAAAQRRCRLRRVALRYTRARINGVYVNVVVLR